MFARYVVRATKEDKVLYVHCACIQHGYGVQLCDEPVDAKIVKTRDGAETIKEIAEGWMYKAEEYEFEIVKATFEQEIRDN